MISSATSDKLVICGARPLYGEVTITGAKNSVLKLMAAALLTPHEITLHNVPRLSDVNVMIDVVRHLGCQVTFSGSVMTICAKTLTSTTAPYELVSKMRASFTVLGALLGRTGEAKVSLPGGCSIGKRGVDLHVKGLQALGADVVIDHGYVEASAHKLVGNDIVLDIASVGATENIMLAAVLAQGTTTISNAAQEPEIIDLANFLNALGARVSGAGTQDIVIEGVSLHQLHGAEFTVIPDRIEAATYLLAGAAAHGEIVLRQAPMAGLTSLTHKLHAMGALIETLDDTTIKLTCHQRLKAENIITQVYPGFPTDLQAPFMALQTLCDGVSVSTETIYENRFNHVGELQRMGAQIQLENNVAIVTGVTELSGAPVKASDLRAGAALIIAGLAAQGETEIMNVHYIDRGYESVEEKLRGLGAHVQRISTEPSAVELAV